jgi:hypothetical protein
MTRLWSRQRNITVVIFDTCERKENNMLTVCVLFIQYICVNSNPLDEVYLLSKDSFKDIS